ncbi:uncharacterized protein LOC129759115 [Uranotaenia lowii]|uniref:uncharacterized protein LOC129759115 n=1 Tax=Uranotaenia lowii TaxID=190385 RepID=UPI002479570A|nr:uncharacterized protein LOC129759115 [Uranotaenia lowii]
MKSVLIVTLLLGSSFIWADAVIFEKNCIKPDESYTFDEDRFIGKWYEIRRFYDANQADQEDCVQEVYTRSKNMIDLDIVRSVQIGQSGLPQYSSGIASPKVFGNSRVPQFYLRYNTTSPADPALLNKYPN